MDAEYARYVLQVSMLYISHDLVFCTLLLMGIATLGAYIKIKKKTFEISVFVL